MPDTIDPAWLAHRYDPGQDAVHYIRVERSQRRSVPFLTDEYLRPGPATIIDRHDALDLPRSDRPVHMIFHSAFCCSTLLAAALDVSSVASSFKEPVILNDLIGWMHRGADRRQLAERLDNALMLLRPFEDAEASIIKPSNVFNGLAVAVMGLRPNARAILMHAPLRTFIASIARKGLWGRRWVRDLLQKQLLENYVDLKLDPQEYFLLTDLQVAAVTWLAQQKAFAGMADRWPQRVRTLNSETFIAQPKPALAATAKLFELSMTDRQIDCTVGEVFTRNSKDGAAFAAGQRAKTAREGEALHQDEIDKVVLWAEAVARTADVPLDLPASLI